MAQSTGKTISFFKATIWHDGSFLFLSGHFLEFCMEKQTGNTTINNSFYDDLNEDWYHAFNHPIALLRAENAIRNPWILKEIKHAFPQPVSVLDVGCGGGFLTNTLAKEGHTVTGIDLSEKSLKIAKKHDKTNTVSYIHANAYNLPFEKESFHVVCAMDILEHVEDPLKLIQEASRVLKQGGLFLFHTFNRNLLSYFMIIKGVEWFVKNTPKNMHVYSLFIKPQEMHQLCNQNKLSIQTLIGLKPSFSFPLFKMLCTKNIPKQFSFHFCKSLMTGYCGIAKKEKS